MLRGKIKVKSQSLGLWVNVSQWVRSPAIKVDDLSFTSRIHRVGGGNGLPCATLYGHTCATA